MHCWDNACNLYIEKLSPGKVSDQFKVTLQPAVDLHLECRWSDTGAWALCPFPNPLLTNDLSLHLHESKLTGPNS